MDNKERFLTVRISEELLEKMRAIAKQHSRSLTGEVRVALQEYADIQGLKPQSPYHGR